MDTWPLPCREAVEAYDLAMKEAQEVYEAILKPARKRFLKHRKKYLMFKGRARRARDRVKREGERLYMDSLGQPIEGSSGLKEA